MAMKGPLPICFATLPIVRNVVDGNNARQDGCNTRKAELSTVYRMLSTISPLFNRLAANP